MSTELLRPLKQSLLNEYGHFADQRLKKIDSGSLFIVDDRIPSDHGADRKLYPWFCLIFADVIEPNAVKVTMRGGIPRSANVEKWIRRMGSTTRNMGCRSLSRPMMSASFPFWRKLCTR